MNNIRDCDKVINFKVGKQIVWVVVVVITLFGNKVWAQENEDKKKNDLFSIAPAFSFAWYPFTKFFEEESTNTKVDLNNFGMSAIISLKLYKKVGVHLNLKIDDPTFQKLIDIAGYVSASYFLLKYDYHSFGGTVSWIGNTPNPIPDEVSYFHNQWYSVSLLFRVDQWVDKVTLKNDPNFFTYLLFGYLSGAGLIGAGSIGAIGIGYASFDMPLEYKVRSDSGLSNPGFGLIKGNAWGLSILWDTLTWRMERPTSIKSLAQYINFLWIYVDMFSGLSFITKGETDAKAIAWMSNANNDIAVDANIKPSYSIFKIDLGLQFVWDVGKKGRMGLAIGAELLEETIAAASNDINIYFYSRHIGPAVRISVRW